MTEIKVERRKAQRVSANLNLQVRLARPDGTEASATLETINISSSGVYFRSDHFIEPMTKLAMELEVSIPPSAGTEDNFATVPCEGLVVRTNPDKDTEGCRDYEIAVFFTQIEPEGMVALEKHIAMLMTDED